MKQRNAPLPSYDLLIGYVHHDAGLARKLYDRLTKHGVRVFDERNLPPTENIYNALSVALQTTGFYLLILTEAAVRSSFILDEIRILLKDAVDRSKIILPVCTSSNILEQAPELSFYLSKYPMILIKNDSDEEIDRIAQTIAVTIFDKYAEDKNYEKLAEYIHSGVTNKATKLLCELITNTCQTIHIRYSACSVLQSKAIFSKLLPLLEKLNDIYDYQYGKDASKLAHQKLKTMDRILELLSLFLFQTDDLFFISLALRFLYFDREIRRDAIDAISHGDLLADIIHAVPEEEYIEKQKPYLAAYHYQLISQNFDDPSATRYTDNERQIIRDTLRYIYRPSQKSTDPVVPTTPKDDDKLLQAVASFMREGNKLFDIISEQYCADDFLRCLLISYERLKNYCEIVDEKSICAECIDRIHELSDSLQKTRSTRSDNPKANDGIKSLLGLTLPKSGTFDVFISHKSEDSDIALDMYRYLNQNLKEAFYDKESLAEMSESQYRKSIMQALDGSAHFVVILSNLDYLHSYWVSLEMDIFQSEIDEGRKPNSNFIMVVTNKVYDEIMQSNKAVLPIQYRRCEIMRVEEYQSKLMSYLNKRLWGDIV